MAPVILIASLILSACGSKSSTATTSIEGALRFPRFSALPICWFGERGTVYFVEDREVFYYCDGRKYVALDLGGLDGIDGVSWVVNVDEAPADSCPGGGVIISSGPDADGNGAADEVTSSRPVCDGIDGMDGADGQDGTSCSVTGDGAGAVTIACEDGTVATVSDGQNGQDGQDGTSCTVIRDDASGTTTISCEDGTFAVVEDGQDGQDGASCTVGETAAGAAITCGGDTVEITGGEDGSSCSASTGADGAVTISCDDGTSVTIPAGDGDGAATVEQLCEVLEVNFGVSLGLPRGLECEPSCPCFKAEEIAASSDTGCVVDFDPDGGRITVSVGDGGDGFFDDGVEFRVEEGFGGDDSFCEVDADFSDRFTIFQNTAVACAQEIENAVGPCLPAQLCDDRTCPQSTNPCGENICVFGDIREGECVLQTFDNGTACTTIEGNPGQCFLGICQPTAGGGGGPISF